MQIQIRQRKAQTEQIKKPWRAVKSTKGLFITRTGCIRKAEWSNCSIERHIKTKAQNYETKTSFWEPVQTWKHQKHLETSNKNPTYRMTDETKSKISTLYCSTVELQNTSAKRVICFPSMTNISFCLSFLRMCDCQLFPLLCDCHPKSMETIIFKWKKAWTSLWAASSMKEIMLSQVGNT